LKTAVALFLFGAIVGNIFNSFHAFSGTIPVTPTHINPLLDWSSYLLFGFAGLSIGVVTLVHDKHLRNNPPGASWLNAIGACALLGVFYFISACMFLSNTTILIVLIAGFGLMLWIYDRSVFAISAAVIVAIGGTGIEIFFTNMNYYSYARPQFMGVTWWLPFLYGIGAVAAGQWARALRGQNEN
jgi:hypothetical protein